VEAQTVLCAVTCVREQRLRPVFDCQINWNWSELETLNGTDHFARRDTEIEQRGGDLRFQLLYLALEVVYTLPQPRWPSFLVARGAPAVSVASRVARLLSLST
jgi:hypothetical protein